VTPDELLAIGDSVVAQARSGEQVEAVATWSRETEARAYDGAVEAFTSAESAGIGVRVVADHRAGFAWAGTFEPQAIADALDEARDNASFATPDEHAGLAEPDGVAVAALELFDERLATTSTDDKIALVINLEAAVRAADPRISGVESVEYADETACAAVVSTTGIRTSSVETACSLAAYILASEGDETTTGFGFSVGRHPGELDSEATTADAVMRAVRMLGARPARSERLTIVLDPWVTAQFLGIIAGVFAGDSVLKGRSLFADRLGEQVASPLVTLVDDPTDARAWGATETDGEGLATRATTLIDGGSARAFLHDSYTARALGATSTGSAVRYGFKSTPSPGPQAVSLAPGTATAEQIWAQVGDGLLIQEVSGLHSGVNPVSGDFSTGAEGVRIRNGVPAESVREVTIASTLQRMLSEVVAVGSDVEYFPMDAAGVSLAIADVTLSGGGE
jgi:PmbA protein